MKVDMFFDDKTIVSRNRLDNFQSIDLTDRSGSLITFFVSKHTFRDNRATAAVIRKFAIELLTAANEMYGVETDAS